MDTVGYLHSDVKALKDEFIKLYGESTASELKRYEKLYDEYKKSFGNKEFYCASSSGRVELCGNHTDHNGGKVVACAISLDTLAFFYPSQDGKIFIKSQGYSDILIDLNGKNENVKKGTSAALVLGVVKGYENRGLKVGGFKACLTSNVVGGAGISSSASFELLIAEILNFLYNNNAVDMQTKAIVSQYAENEYFGKPCGLLDQTAISYGGIKLLDFSTEGKISVKDINNNLEDYTLILINTGGSHSNLTNEYASIPSDMKAVAKALGGERLVDISKEKFLSKIPKIKDKVSGRAIVRAAHFYNENERVDKFVKALNDRDYDSFLNAVKESGERSFTLLQNCYVPGEVEQRIPLALAVAKEYLHGGANRVHGGGFAGTILNVVKNCFVEDFVASMSKYYDEKDIIVLKVRQKGTTVI